MQENKDKIPVEVVDLSKETNDQNWNSQDMEQIEQAAKKKENGEGKEMEEEMMEK